MAEHSRHSRLDPAMEQSARKSDMPDPDLYDFPASPRESSANLWLSGIILVLALIVAIWLLWAFMT